MIDEQAENSVLYAHCLPKLVLLFHKVLDLILHLLRVSFYLVYSIYTIYLVVDSNNTKLHNMNLSYFLLVFDGLP